MDDAVFAALTLIDGRGDPVSGEHKVTHDSHRWFLKCLASAEVACKELLAYRLSAGIANVAEVRRVSHGMDLARPDGELVHVRGDNVIIVRLVQDYSLEDLTLKGLDKAVAGELVFSTWIRRRDSYVGNTGYVDGVPVCFDHHVAFDEHGQPQTGTAFFADRTDGGHAGMWELQEIPEAEEADLQKLREASGAEGRAIHFVHSKQDVNRHIDYFAKRIREISDATISEMPGACGLEQDAASRVAGNLHTTRASLGDDMGLLRRQLGLPDLAG